MRPWLTSDDEVPGFPVNSDHPAAQPSPRAAVRVAVVGGGAIVLLGLGWFLLAHYVMAESAGDAMGEAVGVMLALLVVASIIGAVRAARGRPG